MRKAGTVFLFTGALLLLAAAALVGFNRQQSNQAREAAVAVMPQLVRQIQENASSEIRSEEELQQQITMELEIPVELLTPEDVQMPELEVDGNGYIGYLSIPKLQLDLPIQGSWSYPKLQISPCRYTGSLRGEDLVLMAHNYNSHFGRLSQLSMGDAVQFTDINGNVVSYCVMGKDVLPPTAVEEITSGDFDLTLFTCTYGGSSRITVYCDLDT